MMFLPAMFLLLTLLSYGEGREIVDFKETINELQISTPKPIKACCHYNGIAYYPNQVIRGICFRITCTKYGWRSSNIISKQCASCLIWQDPDFNTFDSVRRYKWHGKCNYTLVEPTTFGRRKCVPYPAVHGNLEKCGISPKFTCLEQTTFKVDANTVVTIDHSSLLQIKVNGVPWTVSSTIPTQVSLSSGLTPVIVWKQKDSHFWCVNIQGADFSIYACRPLVKIYIPTSYKGKVGGLCGFYNGIASDDHRKRDGTILPVNPNPFDFPVSWLSAEQPRRTCKYSTEYRPSTGISNNRPIGNRPIGQTPIGGVGRPPFRVPQTSIPRFGGSTSRIPEVFDSMFIASSVDKSLDDLCPQKKEFNEKCSNTIGSSTMISPEERKMLIESCVDQLCEDPTNADFWLNNAGEVAQNEDALASRTQSRPMA